VGLQRGEHGSEGVCGLVPQLRAEGAAARVVGLERRARALSQRLHRGLVGGQGRGRLGRREVEHVAQDHRRASVGVERLQGEQEGVADALRQTVVALGSDPGDLQALGLDRAGQPHSWVVAGLALAERGAGEVRGCSHEPRDQGGSGVRRGRFDQADEGLLEDVVRVVRGAEHAVAQPPQVGPVGFVGGG
jgi:hypothetical protein